MITGAIHFTSQFVTCNCEATIINTVHNKITSEVEDFEVSVNNAKDFVTSGSYTSK